jgi:type II secretory pathway component PulF
VKGVVTAAGEGGAFERLRANGFAAVSLTPAVARPQAKVKPVRLSDADTVDLVGNLGHLLAAGADIRTALGILAARAPRRQVTTLCKALTTEIGGGAALDVTFETLFVRHGAFIGAMVAAGEASGDLAGGLARAAEIIDSRAKLRAKLGGTLAYPSFVLVSTIAAVLALLLFVIPSLAPLVDGSGTPAPASLALMMSASALLRENGYPLAIVLAAGAVVALLAQRAGLLGRLTDRILLDGPTRRTAAGVLFGGFAIVVGGMLSAGAPMSDTLRLAVRSLGSPAARRRLEPAQIAVRQGQSLSQALDEVKAFPTSIAKLAAVGEATGSLGPMLVRGGKLEEEAAVARIERLGQLLGPAMIVGLGGLVGLLMAGLLSGVSQLGQSALQ